MEKFPRTMVGNRSVSRMIIGTNWFVGFSHGTVAKDRYIHENVAEPRKIAEILGVFFRGGVDTIMGMMNQPLLLDAVKEAENATGVEAILVSTPSIPVSPETPEKGLDCGEIEKILDGETRIGTAICMPHQSTTDCLLDRCTRKIRHMDALGRMIAERGMIPGLSSHMPECIVYADESGLDVASYITPYNLMGFLMQVEVDWVADIIRKAKKPVMTIKPMAAGHLRPFQALTFVWNTIRDEDMVTVGTMSPREAEECVELSLSILERRKSQTELQSTRSKASVQTQPNPTR